MNLGRMIYGYCEGYFGRDSYKDKTIEAEGWDWIVGRNISQEPEFCSFADNQEKEVKLASWSKIEKDI